MYSNAIYGNIGIGGLWFTPTGYYERMLRRNAQPSKISTFIKAGFGAAGYWEGESQYILGHYGILTGTKKHHLEVSAGFVKAIGEGFDDFFPLSGLVGYRLQKPEGHFVFRTGVGWPEAFYLGLGVSF